MSDQAVLLPKSSSLGIGRIISAKGQLDYSYIYFLNYAYLEIWPYVLFSPHPLCTFCKNYFILLQLVEKHCITLYYTQQKISWKPGKISKFQLIHSIIQIWTDFHKNEVKKKFQEKNSKWPIFQNGRFSKSPILEMFLQKFYRLVLGLV